MADKDFVVKNGLVVANGNISVTGTVDGRDVATDGTKLDGIESGATADQTASEILTAIKTVDGAASGLDADLLDGQEGTYYLDFTNATNIPDPTLTLDGDVSGSATFTNLGNATLTVAVVDDSHNHIISNVDGLQTALDAKLALAGGTMTGNLIFGDNVKATFGAGSDLQIYHDGLNSFIDEVGTGRLYIRASDGIYMSSPSNALYLSTFDTGDLSLYHNGNAKLTTTATVIDVTGTVTATTSGIIPTIFGGTGATQTLTLQNTNGNSNNAKILIGNIVSSDNGGISLFSAGTSASTLRMRVSGTTGDISF